MENYFRCRDETPKAVIGSAHAPCVLGLVNVIEEAKAARAWLDEQASKLEPDSNMAVGVFPRKMIQVVEDHPGRKCALCRGRYVHWSDAMRWTAPRDPDELEAFGRSAP